MEPLLEGLLRSSMKFASEGFRKEISTSRQLLRSLGPLPETSAQTPPDLSRSPPPGAFPVVRLAGRLSLLRLRTCLPATEGFRASGARNRKRKEQKQKKESSPK